MRRVTEKDLRKQVISLTAGARKQIETAQLSITDFDEVARLFNIVVVRTALDDCDGSYSKDKRKIILNNNIFSRERVNFSFCHELTHALIEDDEELLSDFADAYIADAENVMERLCNVGAAEILVPSESVRELISKNGFSASLIPELCKQFPASSIAISYQILSCVSHECYLIIAERKDEYAYDEITQIPLGIIGERLYVTYAGRSNNAKYPIKRDVLLPPNHALQSTVNQPNIAMRLDAKVPIGKSWTLLCDAIYYQDKVFAFFHQTEPPLPVNPDQLSLF